MANPICIKKLNIQFLILNPTKQNFIAGFFQDKSIGNLSSLSQTSQKVILELSKGNSNLPIVNLQQLYDIIMNEPLTPDIFIHLMHQLLMNISPENL